MANRLVTTSAALAKGMVRQEPGAPGPVAGPLQDLWMTMAGAAGDIAELSYKWVQVVGGMSGFSRAAASGATGAAAADPNASETARPAPAPALRWSGRSASGPVPERAENELSFARGGWGVLSAVSQLRRAMTTAGGRRDEQITDHRYVTVDGNRAAWLFAEFETSESLSDLTRWLTPQDWPQWGGTIFKEMKPIGKRKPGRSGYEWQAKYLEVVNLAGQELNTVLRCDFGRTAKWAAMTYDLDHSVDNMLQVDRGFLLAVEAPNKRRQVKALKVVGFTIPFETFVVEEMGGQWTGWYNATHKAGGRGRRQGSVHRASSLDWRPGDSG